MFKVFALIFLFTSCSSVKKDQKSWETWKGRSTSELKEHPYFKNLKKTTVTHENTPDTWIYKNQTPLQTSAFCQSLGGCLSLPTYNCEHAFSVENDTILEYEQKGTCPDRKTIEAKNR